MPKAVFWYGVYCVLFALFNLGLFAISVWFMTSGQALANEAVSKETIFWTGVVCAPLSILMGIGDIWTMRAKDLKDPWAFHMTNIAVGIGTCVLTPFALILFLCWFHPAVREWYRSGVNRP
jgi:hypothetical protein